MKTFELCYLGKVTNGHRFRVTCVTENSEKVEGNFGDLFFKKPILKGMWIGGYCTADTEDETTYKNWKQISSPQVKLDAEVITQFSIEYRAKLSKATALRYAKNQTRDVDALIHEMRDSMFMLSKGERAAFAMYVYQMLTQ